MLWAWGAISPQMLQRIMALFLVDLQAAADGSLDISKVQDFANLGYGGKHPQTMNKQLTDSLRGHQLPSPHNFMVPLRHTVLGFFTEHLTWCCHTSSSLQFFIFILLHGFRAFVLELRLSRNFGGPSKMAFSLRTIP